MGIVCNGNEIYNQLNSFKKKYCKSVNFEMLNSSLSDPIDPCINCPFMTKTDTDCGCSLTNLTLMFNPVNYFPPENYFDFDFELVKDCASFENTLDLSPKV